LFLVAVTNSTLRELSSWQWLFDANGEVTCVNIVSGHPLLIGSAIDSVRRWKFRSYLVNGMKKSFCGKVALRYEATDYAVKYEIIQAP